MIDRMGAHLILAAGNDGGVLQQIHPDPGPAQPVVNSVIVVIDAVLALCILASAAACIIGFSAKRGGVMAGNDLAARHGQGLLVGGAVGLLGLLGIGTLFGIMVGLAP